MMKSDKTIEQELRLYFADAIDDYAEYLLGSDYSGKMNREDTLDFLVETHSKYALTVAERLIGEDEKFVNVDGLVFSKDEVNKSVQVCNTEKRRLRTAFRKEYGGEE